MKKFLTTLAAAALALSVTACGAYQLTAEERQSAELGARDTADRSQADYVGCSGSDSDRDGYVTCSIKSRANPGTQTDLLCSYASGSRGCKRKV